MLDCCISVAIQMEAKNNQFNWIAKSSTQLLPLRTKTVDFGCSNHLPNVAFFFTRQRTRVGRIFVYVALSRTRH
jgi:hypothetical protein